MLLTDALDIRAGSVEVTKMYAGDIQVWPSLLSPGNFSLSATPLAEPTFPIGISGRNYIDAAGLPFYGVGDTLWNGISRMTRAEFTSYCTTRKAQGYTAILLSLLDINNRGRAQTVSGTTPFNGTNNSADFTSRNLTGTISYWAQVQWCVDELASFGMVAVLVPCWYGYTGNMWRGHIASSDSDVSIANSYGTFLGGLLGDRENVWWMHGGDNPPTNANGSTNGVWAGLPRVSVVAATNALATSIKNAATVPQLTTYHTVRDDVAFNYFGSESWYDLHAAYSAYFAGTNNNPHYRVLNEYARTPAKPVMLTEMLYARRDDTGLSPDTSRLECRSEAWQSMLSGALTTANGNEVVWQVRELYGSWVWTDAINDPESLDLKVLSRVFQTFRDKTFIADQSSPLVTSNRGDGTTVAPGLISNDGSVAIIYIPSSRTVTINTAAVSSSTWRWVHPETAEIQEATSFTTPSGWSDAILIAAPWNDEDSIDGGTPSQVDVEILDGGSPSSVSSGIIDGGTP